MISSQHEMETASGLTNFPLSRSLGCIVHHCFYAIWSWFIIYSFFSLWICFTRQTSTYARGQGSI